ncbi:MAG: lysine-sensitive aspartokinase 3 [Planctomycetes bacterium]|nr:lysine-sensitive aspartokinase 3 [Planctomycetota bacterium]
MPLVVKFGGTSVGSPEAMREAAAIVRGHQETPILVVLSAMSKVTDTLLSLGRRATSGDCERCHALLDELRDRHLACAETLLGSYDDADRHALATLLDDLFGLVEAQLATPPHPATARELDRIVGFGERLSSHLFASYVRSLGSRALWMDATQFVVTDDQFGAAAPDEDLIFERVQEHVSPRFAEHEVIVTQGFLGASHAGTPTTLGRGGSDFSAALLGAALGAREIQIWTDVEGVLSADPRIVANARGIQHLSAAEAGELAAFGAKVLHPATIHPAVRAGIPVTVRHTRKPTGGFTTITQSGASGRDVVAIASRGPIHVVTARSPRMLHQAGFLARLFEVFAHRRVSVDLIATAEVSVSLTVEHDAPLEALEAEIGSFCDVSIARERSIVAVVGEHLKKTRGVTARAFHALEAIPIEMISMGANEINLSVVVDRTFEHDVVRHLHRALIEESNLP